MFQSVQTLKVRRAAGGHMDKEQATASIGRVVGIDLGNNERHGRPRRR